jgi:hypothetical protein
MDLLKIQNIFLRFGVAFAFLFPPINATFDPMSWMGYFPKFLHGIVSNTVLLHSFGVLEVVLALWILSGKKIFVPSLVAVGMLVLIVLFNLQDFQILFRDISIATMALALAVGAWKENFETTHI